MSIKTSLSLFLIGCFVLGLTVILGRPDFGSGVMGGIGVATIVSILAR